MWFQTTSPLDEPYRASSASSTGIYDTEGSVNLCFQTSGGSTAKGKLKAIYAPSAPINFISTGQLKKDGIKYDTYNSCFVNKKLRQEVAVVT